MARAKLKLVPDYCLRCHRPLEAHGKKARTCGSCQFINLDAVHKNFWSHSPLLEQNLKYVKRAAVTCTVLSMPIFFLIDHGMFNPGSIESKIAGCVLILTCVVPIPVWITTDRFLKKSGLPNSVIWVAFFSPFMLFGLVEGFAHNASIESRLTFFIAFFGILMSLFARTWFKNWRTKRISEEIDINVIRECDLKRSDAERGTAKYCLRCFASMPESSGVCEQCHFNNIPSDRRGFWNRNPRILAWERTAKGAAIALGTILAIWSLLGPTHRGMASGWAIGMNLAFAYALCMTFSKLSRHMPSFRPSIVWSATCLILYMTMTPVIMLQESSASVKIAAMLGCLAMAAFIQVLARLFKRWKLNLQKA